MSYLVVITVDDPEDCSAILEAWESLGVSGATVIESTGMGRLKKGGLRDDLPLIPHLSDFLDVRDESHRTIFSVVDDEAKVEAMAAATHRIIGSLDEPHTGFMFVVPVLKAYGLGRGK